MMWFDAIGGIDSIMKSLFNNNGHPKFDTALFGKGEIHITEDAEYEIINSTTNHEDKIIPVQKELPHIIP